jgi:FKBP-type peptidyl-prolyl cis-trans isomerase (trigger factor)
MTQDVKQILDDSIKKNGKEALIESFKRDLKKAEENRYTEEQKALIREICQEALDYLTSI